MHHFYWKTWQIFLHSSTVIFRSDFLEKWWIKGTFKKLSTCNLPKFTLKSVEVLELFNAQSDFYTFFGVWCHIKSTIEIFFPGWCLKYYLAVLQGWCQFSNRRFGIKKGLKNILFSKVGLLILDLCVRGGSGDAYNLSGLILEQALVSPIPNALMLSFLRHSLAAQTISHGSVLEAIATYSDFNYLKTRFVQSIYFISNRWKLD